MSNSLRIKVCGLKDRENISEVLKLGPDYAGFIFYPKSKRYVQPENISRYVKNNISRNIQKVGVFVNALIPQIKSAVDDYGLDFIQLHGDESFKFCKELKALGYKIIKAFRIHSGFDLASLSVYVNCCDYFLFDNSTEAYGGSGQKFNWATLEKYDYITPFFLSGGIGLEDAHTIKGLEYKQLYGIDINSRFEISPGMKEIEKIKDFIQIIRK